MKKIVTIIGARPQIIKAAAISRAISTSFSEQISEVIVHTGQHYDEKMSNVFFDELGIPKPNYNLNVGSGQHGEQTAKMLTGIEKILKEESADALLVYGDTNSTLAGAVAASKIHIPVIHIEAGLRSYNKRMPEELNRILCDHSSTLLFAPTQSAIDNLKKEGLIHNEELASIDSPNVYHSGDIMFDNSLHFASIASKSSKLLSELNCKPGEFALATVHRAENTDDNAKISAIFKGLYELAEDNKKAIILPLHPRTKKVIEKVLPAEFQQKIQESAYLRLIEPVSFIDMIALEKNAQIVVTDSGGVQKEAFFFEKPCVILREETEWVELVENGNAILAGANVDRMKKGYADLLAKPHTYPSYYGDGKAAEFIISTILVDLLG